MNRPLQKLLFLCLMPLCLLLASCELPSRISASKTAEQLQKRLTYSHSDARIAQMVTQLVDERKPLLIADQANSDGWPLPDIGVVVLYEQTLCELPKSERDGLLTELKNDSGLPERFQVLLLSSCAPDFTPSVLARSLKQVRAARQWPPSYDAYFKLLERHHKALVRLENLYGNLKERMDTTIEKLTEIEVETQP